MMDPYVARLVEQMHELAALVGMKFIPDPVKIANYRSLKCVRAVPSWDDYFMGLAEKAKERSKDPSTQVGAVLADDERSTLETGYNGFAPGVAETPELWERPHKYGRVIHAEANAIARAAKRGRAVDGATLYVTAFPCQECAKLIIAAGVKRIVSGPPLRGWDKSNSEAMTLLEEAGVEFVVNGAAVAP